MVAEASRSAKNGKITSWSFIGGLWLRDMTKPHQEELIQSSGKIMMDRIARRIAAGPRYKNRKEISELM